MQASRNTAHFVADKKYAEIARTLGLKADTTEQGVQSLVNAVRDLSKKVGLEPSIQAYGVDEKLYLSKINELADKAFEDQCTTANPKLPLVKELAAVYKEAYYGTK